MNKDEAIEKFETEENRIKGIDKNIGKLSKLFERLEVRETLIKQFFQNFTENLALAVRNLEGAHLKGVINSNNLAGYLRQ